MDFDQLYWIIPITLLFVAIIQTLYWIWLNRSAASVESRGKASPIMPTSPHLSASQKGNMSGNYSDNMQTGGFQGTMIILEGLHGTNEIRLPKSSFGIGRFYNPDEDILIALDERSISRRHAYFSVESTGFYLTDTGSSYGVMIYMNDTYVKLSPGQRELVYNNDVILFGNTVKVQLQLPGPSRN
jgi:pSer/pThr/pTyr-binding forkhead associated (FHA) protein